LKTSALYRIASVLLVLFAVGHTAAFRLTDPKLGIGPLVESMQTIHFEVPGFTRTYWDFYVRFGFLISVFLLFAAVLAWQLGGIPADVLARMPGATWGLAICFAIVSILNGRYFFVEPIVFSIVITAFLIAAAWLSAKPSSS
jgi:hypothetical protein